ncbi:MAG: hypothetical protein JXA10_12860, partial [Anaerolineae bacterium]|nr:hypothetical protein [Anaerolineae bacterium]
GGFLFGADDGYSYLAKMRLGTRGDWLFTIRYTHEPHDGALLFFPYILLGKLTGLFVGTDNPDLPTALALVFHGARIICGMLLIFCTYRFVAAFLRCPESRMLALVLISLGGGFGWLLSLLGMSDLFDSLPVDFYVPEGYSFLILFGLPHLALARSAMLIGFLLLFRALLITESPRVWLRWTTLAGLVWIVMGLCVPFYIAVLYLILGVWGLAAWLRARQFPWALFWRAVSAALVVLPVLLYTSIVFLTSDVLGEWSAQNLLPSPHPLHYVFGYIVLAIPAVVALRWAWRKSESLAHATPLNNKKGVPFAFNPRHLRSSASYLPYLLLASWIAVMPVVVYLPINVQRRLAEGVIVPLGILAVVGLRLLFPHRRQWLRARRVVLLLTLPTAVFFWLGTTFSVLSPGRPLFHPRDELAVMDTLNAVVPRDAVVLSLKATGNYLPVRADVKAYVGHGPETINSTEKEALAEQFFAGKLDADAHRALLVDVDYVFFGPLEAEISDPARSWAEDLQILAPCTVDDSYLVYEVLHAD